MLSLAIVLDFVLPVWIKISSIAGIIHSKRQHCIEMVHSNIFCHCRYLCEFIYYCSLNQSKRPEYSGSSVVFIHVPILDNPYSKTQLAHALKYVVLEILKQRNSHEQCKKCKDK